jgi:integrative and conjugative element protein (TIGR02256 family)
MLAISSNHGLRLCSPDGRFGLDLGTVHVAAILSSCQRASDQETGGVLIGYYNPSHNLAFVTEVTPAPPDSKHGATWFDRGVKGLTGKLHLSWKKTGSFYLGEWHYHPGATPDPSSTDSTQMASIAGSRRYACPEPVLLIIGGKSGAWTVGAFVYEKGTIRHTLSQCDSEIAQGRKNGKPSGTPTHRG